MSWFNIIKVIGQGGMTPEQQTASTKNNQTLMDRVKALGVKDTDQRLAGSFNPAVYQMVINQEEAKLRQPQQKPNANSEAIRTVARNVEAKNKANGNKKESVGAAAMRAMAEGKDPTKAGMATVARNVKLPDGPLTPQEEAQRKQKQSGRNQTSLPVIDRPLTREERMQRNQNKQQVKLPQKEQPPKETKTVPIPAKPQKTQQQQLTEQLTDSVPLPRQRQPVAPQLRQLSQQLESKTVPLPRSAKNQLRRDSQSKPLPKPEELSPEVKQTLQRKVGQVVNPPVKDRAKPLGDTLNALEGKGRNRRDSQLAAIRARRKEIQSERQKLATAPSSGGL